MAALGFSRAASGAAMWHDILLTSIFVQVALTFWAVLAMGRARVASLKAKETAMADIAVTPTAYPPHVQLFAANAHNQFETPILFFAAAALAVALDQVSVVLALSGAVFVVFRLLHRREHVGRNNLRMRFNLFLVGFLALIVMWVALGVGILLAR